MKACDLKKLPVYIKNDSNVWTVKHKDYFINQFYTKDDATSFCRNLGFNIVAYIYNKNNTKNTLSDI